MAEQETQERDDAASATEEDGSTGSTGSTGKDPASSDSATEESGSGQETESQESEPEAEQKSAKDQKAEQKSAKADEKAEQKSAKADEKAEQKSAKAEQKAEQKSAKADQKAEKEQSEGAPARRSENHAKPEQLSEEDRQAQERSRSTYGRGDDEGGRSIDVPELIWKGANVLATVVRAVTLLFAAILVIQIGLSVAAVNPANGFARFVRGFSDTVVLGFRDLFLPADPTVMLIVNYGVAAVFWVLVGVFVSSGLRWVAARIT